MILFFKAGLYIHRLRSSILKEAESINSSNAEVENAEDEMVARRNMTADQFFLGGRPAAQQQQPQDKE